MKQAKDSSTTNLIPDPNEFAEWVEFALKAVGKAPSRFLRDADRPGSKNRVSFFLKNPTQVQLRMARRLQLELIQEATRIGVHLPEFPVAETIPPKEDGDV